MDPPCPHLRHQHRHAQVLEAAGVGVAALLDPQVAHAQLLAKPGGRVRGRRRKQWATGSERGSECGLG